MKLECCSVLVLPKHLLLYLHTMKHKHPFFTVREDNNKDINVRSTTLFDALT